MNNHDMEPLAVDFASTAPMKTISDDTLDTTMPIQPIAITVGVDEEERGVSMAVIVTIAILLFLMFIIIGANSLIVLSFVGKHIRRTKSNFYMLQLAIADVCVSFVMPINILAILSPMLAGSTWFCVLETSITVCMLVTSTCCTLALTLDRLEALTKSLEYSADMSPRMYIKRSVAVWFFPFVLCFILPIAWHNDLLDTPYQSCVTLYILRRKYTAYVLLPMIFAIFAAVAIMYVPILRIALRHWRSIHAMEVDVTDGTVNHNKNMKYQLRILKTTTMVFLPFFGGWMPWIVSVACIVSNPDEYYNPGLILRVSLWAPYFGVFNSFINPIIYAARMPEYRQAFRTVLGCNRQRSVQNSVVPSTANRSATTNC